MKNNKGLVASAIDWIFDKQDEENLILRLWMITFKTFILIIGVGSILAITWPFLIPYLIYTTLSDFFNGR